MRHRSRAKRVGSSFAGLALVLAAPLAEGGLDASLQDARWAQYLRSPLAAQEVGARIPDSRDRVARATRIRSEIVVDGRLDEADWARAEVVTGFIQREPDEGQPAAERTEVRILYDDGNVYVGARLFDSDTARMARQLTRRDETGRAAGYLEFSFDPNFDRTTGYTFRVTAAGVQRDEYNYDDTRSDRSWDGVWESAVTVDGDGWMVEARVPLSQLRHEPSAEPQSWGVNFARRRIAANERSEWAFVPIGTSGEVSRWGRLEGLDLPERRRYAEIVPYAMSSLERAPAEAGDPFFDGTEVRSRVGADVRYGLGATFVVDATLNPDFGQVEVDPRVINLSAFETFFPERRPFFTRDDRLFDFSLSGGRNNLFHSRRIGRSPQGRAPAGADFVSRPGETTILGAGKLTGRTMGGLNVGILVASTGRERGRAYFADRDEHVRFEAEPGSLYGTLRLQQDLWEARSRVGGIVTLAERDLPADGSLDFLSDRALTGGVDFEHTWADRDWALSGFLAGSHVRGSREAILRLQRSSNHRFQRPDQDYLELDPEATSLTGAEWRLEMERRGGRHWTGSVWMGQRSPGFEVNDLGFSTTTERLDGGFRLQYRQPTPGDVFRSYRFSFSSFHNWRHEVLDDFLSASAWGHAHRSGRTSAGAGFTFLNWWSAGIEVEHEPEVLSDVLTRGGPLMVDPGSWSVEVDASTDRRDPVTFRASFEYEDGFRGGNEVSAGFRVEARPTSGLFLSVGPFYERRLDVRQYVTRVEDAAFEPTFGERYFFADLRRQELSLDTRLNVILSPDFSLELFAQPLISAGDFRTYKQLLRSSSFEFDEFSEGDAVSVDGGVACVGGTLCRTEGRIHVDYTGDGIADHSFREQSFNVRSLRGNAVLRWEYAPGSRLYLVWQHTRQDRVFRGGFDLSRDGRALLEADGEHIFMVKVDHWIDF